MENRAKKMIGDFAIRLNELRSLAVEPMKHTESNRPGATIFLGISLFFVIFHSIFLQFQHFYVYAF